MDPKRFGSFIAQRRKQKDMTQSDLAGRIHVTDKAISRWERGIGFPDINTIEPLAEALDLSILEIMKSERIENSSISNKDAVRLMESAAEVAIKNRRQDLTAAVLAVYTIIITAFFAWFGGFANLGGSLFLGAIISTAQISIYYYMDNRDDPGSRKIYAAISLIAIIITAIVLLYVFI